METLKSNVQPIRINIEGFNSITYDSDASDPYPDEEIPYHDTYNESKTCHSNTNNSSDSENTKNRINYLFPNQQKI